MINKIKTYDILKQDPVISKLSTGEKTLYKANKALLKFQFRSKRTVTLWVARRRPNYYDVPHKERYIQKFDDSGQHQVENFDSEFHKRWRAERDWWIPQFEEIPIVNEVRALYPAMCWLHLTVSLNIDDREINKIGWFNDGLRKRKNSYADNRQTEYNKHAALCALVYPSELDDYVPKPKKRK